MYRILVLNYKSIFIAYCFLFFALMLPFLLFGEVVAPHRQYIDLGIVDTQIDTKHIENRKFTDHTHSYIPDVSQNLKGIRSGWLALWSN
jgi:hypothetical protein